MGFWICTTIIDLFVPIFMVIYCNIYRDKAPKDINGSNGYKTTMSRLNRDTWEFANHYYNKLMRVIGWILIAIFFVVMLLTRRKGENTIADYGIILLGVQVVVILVCVIPTETALRKTFDENGRRK